MGPVPKNRRNQNTFVRIEWSMHAQKIAIPQKIAIIDGIATAATAKNGITKS